mgnify:CR=1 FL=1
MITLLCLCLVTLFSLWGYGVSLQSFFTVCQNISAPNKLRDNYLDSIDKKNKTFIFTSDYCLLGLFFVVFSASLINLFFPLSNFSGLVTLTLGVLLSLYFVYKRFVSLRFSQLALIITCSIFIFLKIQDGFFYDTGLYRMPMLKWIEGYPIVFGLANLHGRFGFNSAWLMFHGALRLPFFGWNTLVIGEVTIFVLGLWIMAEGLFTRWHKLPKSIQFLSASILIIYLLQILVSGITVETTDNPANILGLITVVYFLEFLGDQNNNIFQVDRIYLILISCALAITIKVSMLPFVLLPLIALVINLKSMKISRGLVICLSIVTSYFCLWLARNLILSGCLVYPVSQTCFTSLDWAVTAEQAIIEKNSVVGWARSPHVDSYLQTLKNYDWLSEWFKRMIKHQIFLLMIVAVGVNILLSIIIAIFRYVLGNFKYKNLFPMIILFTKFLFPTTLMGILLWFFGGPDPRFAWSFLLLISVPFIAICLNLLEFNKIANFSLNTKRELNNVFFKSSCISLIIVILLANPQFKKPLQWTNSPLNKNKITMENLMDSTILVSIPYDSYQCWDMQPPCTPHYSGAPRVYNLRELHLTTRWIYPTFQHNLLSN